jgi:hypothetical protein
MSTWKMSQRWNKELDDTDLTRDPRMNDFVVSDDCLWDTVARTTERGLGGGSLRV